MILYTDRGIGRNMLRNVIKISLKIVLNFKQLNALGLMQKCLLDEN